MRWRTGELDQRIEFFTETLTPDNQGGQSVSWVSIGSAWAKVKAKAGSEKEDFDQLKNPSTYLFVVRNRSDINEKHRILWNGQYYNIQSIPSLGKRVLYLEIEAARGVTQ